jgi:predicted RNA-binding protein YlqC (UPF0109 family)
MSKVKNSSKDYNNVITLWFRQSNDARRKLIGKLGRLRLKIWIRAIKGIIKSVKNKESVKKIEKAEQ